MAASARPRVVQSASWRIRELSSYPHGRAVTRPVFWILSPVLILAGALVVPCLLLPGAGCTVYVIQPEMKMRGIFCTFVRVKFLAESAPKSRNLHVNFRNFSGGVTLPDRIYRGRWRPSPMQHSRARAQPLDTGFEPSPFTWQASTLSTKPAMRTAQHSTKLTNKPCPIVKNMYYELGPHTRRRK